MPFFIPIILLLVLVAAMVYLVYAWRVRALTNERLADRVLLIDLASEKRPKIQSVIIRIPFVAIVLGLILLIGLLISGVPALISVGFALIFATLVAQIEEAILESKINLLERQLADVIDLMVAALHSNATIPGSIEIAAREIKQPLGPIMEEVSNRIQYGDDPQAVMRMLVEKLPTENFHLFATTLSVHWEVGGKLYPVLATVGSAIRDRIEIHRRLRAVTAQTRLSAATILIVSYILALIVYQYNPPAFRDFVMSPTGTVLVGCAILMQGVGLLILTLMNRTRI